MRYNVTLRQQHDAPVRTVAFLLKPPDAPITGVYDAFWNDERILQFQYRVRIYAMAWQDLAASLALAALVPLGKGFDADPERALRAALETLGTRFALRGLLLDVAEAVSVPASLQDKLFRKEDYAMSVLFQEGWAGGRSEGRSEGRQETLRALIARKYPRARTGLAEVAAWLPLCNDADTDWVMAQLVGAASFADFKSGLEKRLKARRVI